MKKENIILLGLGALSLLVIVTIIKQAEINKAQANLDNQIITFTQIASEKLGIESLATPDFVSSSATIGQ